MTKFNKVISLSLLLALILGQNPLWANENIGNKINEKEYPSA